MKKIFIGCGIVVLLILCGIAFLAAHFWSDLQTFRKQNADAIARLNALTVSAPFDPAAVTSLDAERFARALDVRVQLCADLKGANERLGKLNDPDADIGMLDGMSLTLHELGGMMPRFADRLEAIKMSWPEFAWHSRLFWAVMQRVSLSTGDPALIEFKDEFKRFEASYDKEREHVQLPQLKDLIGDFPPALIAQASAVMVTDIDRVRASLGMYEGERAFMMPGNDPALFGFDKLPEATEERIEAEKQAKPEPAPAPK